MKSTAFSLILFTLLVLPSCSNSDPDAGKANDNTSPTPAYSKAPEITLTMINGESVDLKTACAEKPVILVFWTNWCATCVIEGAEIQVKQAEYEAMGVKIIAVNSGSSLEKVQTLLTKRNWTYAQAIDETGKVCESFGVEGTPTIFVLDKAMNIRYRGEAIPENLAEMVKGF